MGKISLWFRGRGFFWGLEFVRDREKRLPFESDIGLAAKLKKDSGLMSMAVGEITKAKLDILREADHIFIEELISANLYDKVSQAFAVFLPIKSVGVVGDARRYEYVVALRAAETVDFMTAKASQLNHDFLNKVSDRIINEIPKVSRVVYDISSKPPATIEWE